MDITTLDGPSPSDIEKADDKNYATDYAVLVEVFAVGVRGQQARVTAGTELTPGGAYDFASKLREVSRLMTDSWSVDSLYPQQCFEDYGPAFVLRALARAYEEVAK